MKLDNRIRNTGLVVIVIFWFLFIFSWTTIYKPEEIDYGVTFSKRQSESLGLDWKANYTAMLDDLGVRKIRLPVYWNEMHPDASRYNWTDLDWQVDQAEARGAQLILAVGNRVPRWPECHEPEWALKLDSQQRNDALKEFVSEAVVRYRQRPAVTYWQVENEPFLPHFGTCPPLDKKLLDEEIALVRSLDSRPIIVTDSGELSVWVMAARRGDIFGTSVYLNTYSAKLDRYIRYPIKPVFFRVKRNLTNLFAHPQDWYLIELQGEPWGRESFQKLSPEERAKTMDLEKFREIREFARQTGFKTMYWWGVEWWYWEKTVQNNDALWNEAKSIYGGTGN